MLVKNMLKKLVSGGQTGADRGALRAAVGLGIPHGGWCPAGRRAEDGRIPDEYELKETRSKSYPVRTELNVIDSGATMVFGFGQPAGGSMLTVQLARRHGRPCLFADLRMPDCSLDRLIKDWLAVLGTGIVLNVAGPRESESKGIEARVEQVLRRILNARFYPSPPAAG